MSNDWGATPEQLPKSQQTGGPAFPVVGHFYGDKLGGQLAHGMSLRDWFAGMAMQGLLADSSIHGTHAEIANNAYGFADAMIKAREAK